MIGGFDGCWSGGYLSRELNGLPSLDGLPSASRDGIDFDLEVHDSFRAPLAPW